MALFSLINLLAAGVYCGTRSRPFRARTFAGVIAWLAAAHLAMGIYLASNGVDRPKVEFHTTRNF